MRFLLAIAALLTVVSTSAEARHRHHAHYRHHVRATVEQSIFACDNNGRCNSRGYSESMPVAPRGYYYDGRVVGGRHPGDPWAFCGAEAARYVFGSAIRDLWPAANWIRKYPRAQPAPGMAAARSHHVMILMSHVSGWDWLVHDGNGGGHRTWEHVRSIRGYVIVDPHGSRMAAR